MQFEPTAPKPRRTVFDRLSAVPWWAVAVILFGLYIVGKIIYDEQTNAIFNFVKDGVVTTIQVGLMAYMLAITIGVLVGMARLSDNVILYNLSSLYVEVIRGIPMLVLLYMIAFGILPIVVGFLSDIGLPIQMRDIPSMARVVVALAIGYGAYSAEIFRAGIQSIEKGQYEAAQSLGMSYWKTMRHIILPQAIRRIIPALGNDFTAMLKDSALVSVLGVRDLTQLSKLYTSSTFIYLPTWTLTAFIYLSIILLITRFMRWVEGRLQRAYQD